MRNHYATIGFSFQGSNRLDTFGAQQRARVGQQIPFSCCPDEEGLPVASGVGLGSEILVLVTAC